jgi:hypothetical protein
MKNSNFELAQNLQKLKISFQSISFEYGDDHG